MMAFVSLLTLEGIWLMLKLYQIIWDNQYSNYNYS